MGTPLFPPALTTDHMKPFYAGLAAGELRLTACSACGRWLWYPPEVSPCHPDAPVEWRTAAPEGRVYMFSTIHRSLLPGDHRSETPYTVVMVEPDDAPGARVPGVLIGAEPACDMRVRFSPVPAGDGVIAGFTPLEEN